MRLILILVFAAVVFYLYRRNAAGRHLSDVERAGANAGPQEAPSAAQRLSMPAQAPAAPLDDEKRWALTATAQLSAQNRQSHDALNPDTSKPPEFWRNSLSKWWGIKDQAAALAMLDRLAGNEDAEHPAWDLVRLIDVARGAHAARYLSEAEAWGRILPAAAQLRRAYDSWGAMAGGYKAGHDAWRGRSDDSFDRTYRTLTDPQNTLSPWNQVSWHLASPLPSAGVMPEFS